MRIFKSHWNTFSIKTKKKTSKMHTDASEMNKKKAKDRRPAHKQHKGGTKV